MEMHQVRYFLALASTLNFTRAAEECHVTQPALTRSIKQLEDELGGELIRRERNHSHLTELGKRMLPFLQQCYEAANSAKALAQSVNKNEVAPLSITVSTSVNIDLLIPHFSELTRALPKVQLTIARSLPSQVLETLKNGGVDLAIAGPLGQDWDRLDSWALFEDTVEVVVAENHRLADVSRGDSMPLAQLAPETLLGRIDCDFHSRFADCISAAGLALEPSHWLANDHDLLALVAANGYVGIIPASAPRLPSTRRIRLEDVVVTRPVAIYAVAGRHRQPVVATFLNLLRSASWSV
ncbi:MAG: LysR family transcriptional regulator [Rhizobiaceae bacterium]